MVNAVLNVEPCQWFLREKVFVHKEWTGEYNGWVYCMYTCSCTRMMKGVKFVDTNACPDLEKKDNTCPLLEQARVLEAYYRTHNYEKDKKLNPL